MSGKTYMHSKVYMKLNDTTNYPKPISVDSQTGYLVYGTYTPEDTGTSEDTDTPEDTDIPENPVFYSEVCSEGLTECLKSNFSDRRLKNVGEVFKGGLDEIKKLELFNYTYKKDTTKTPHVGVMAQDLQKIFPTAVFKGDDGFLRIRWDEMFFALINAVKELDTKIEKTFSKYTRIAELQQQVVDLKTQNTEMKNQVSELKAMLKEMNEDLESLN